MPPVRALALSVCLVACSAWHTSATKADVGCDPGSACDLCATTACAPGATPTWNGVLCTCAGDTTCTSGDSCDACGQPPCAWDNSGACTCRPMPAECNGDVGCAECLDDGECADGDPVWVNGRCSCDPGDLCLAGKDCAPGATPLWNGVECECVGDTSCRNGGGCDACNAQPCAFDNNGGVCVCMPMPAQCNGDLACAECLNDGECANGDPTWDGTTCVCP